MFATVTMFGMYYLFGAGMYFYLSKTEKLSLRDLQECSEEFIMILKQST